MFMTIKLSVIMLLCLSYFTWNAHEAEAQHQREENVTRRRGTRYNVTWNKNSRRRITCTRNGLTLLAKKYVVHQFPCEHWQCRRGGKMRVTRCRGTKPDHPCIHWLNGKWPTCCYFYYYCRT
ncbi:uncharacterized protein LOC119180317 isoform X1 [Rhipicephalus microplus]|uniref:uncharacterized protein LOC119180317 isoform X1 n=1 Tax=Rhipicephalus microplus TaxID=6941 RepID=UPI003F6B1989